MSRRRKESDDDSFGFILVVAFIFVAMGGCDAEARILKIGVIDTGFDMKYSKNVKLCKTGHYDAVHNRYGIKTVHDSHGHGTHIAETIAKNISVPYCLVILRYFDPKVATHHLANTLKLYRHAMKIGVDIINYSGGGYDKSIAENYLVSQAIKQGIVIVAAAGNDNTNLDKTPYYPAYSHSAVIAVGSAKKYKLRDRVIASKHDFSNYGKKIDITFNGERVFAADRFMSGTSQATAIATGKLAKYILAKKLVEAMSKAGYINGNSDNIYNPIDGLTK